MPVHAVQRGNNRAACFFCDDDRTRYLYYLKDQADQHLVAVHAYVLMGNHVHLLMTALSSDGISQVMKGVGQLYVQHANRTHGRVGTLWQGRYYSAVVDTESYLLCCYRYIESNPVRARMVRQPGDYPWSSHGANALGLPDLVVTPHPVITDLAANEADRRAAYRALFETELAPDAMRQIREGLARQRGRPRNCDKK